MKREITRRHFLTLASYLSVEAFSHSFLTNLFRQKFEYFENYHKKKIVTGLPTGFIDLDHKIKGLQPSDLIFIAGDSSCVSMFSRNIAQHVAIKENVPVTIFPRSAGASGSHIFIENSGHPISLLDMRANLLEIRGKLKQLIPEYEIGLVIVDYMKLMCGPDKYTRDSKPKPDKQLISEISRSLKKLAIEWNIPVLAYFRLKWERRDSQSKLRTVEQYADLILCHVSEDSHYNNSKNKSIEEFIIVKNRRGPTGTVQLVYNSAYRRYENLAC